jgi:hypothetical protein
VLIEADYRMKLIGIGLEEGTLGVASYLSSVEIGKDGKPPPMNVLRWWFTLNYDALSATESRDAFELRGPGARVLSENEWLTERGERVHTGASDELTKRFAESFTKHFDKLSAKYPIYAELRNVFDLSLVSAIVQSHDLPGQVGWHMTHFGSDGTYAPELGPAPTEVESVLSHRVIGGKHIVAAVSGGVRVDAHELAGRDAVKTDTYGLMAGERSASTPQQLPRRELHLRRRQRLGVGACGEQCEESKQRSHAPSIAEPPDEIRGRQVVMAGDGDERPAEVMRHRLEEARLPTPGGALEHNRQALPKGRRENLLLVADGHVVRTRRASRAHNAFQASSPSTVSRHSRRPVSHDDTRRRTSAERRAERNSGPITWISCSVLGIVA